MGESISITNVELVVEDVSAKLANVEAEVKEIEDGLELLMHAVDSQSLKDFLNCIKYKAKSLCDIHIAETFNSISDLEARLTMLREQAVSIGVLPGLTNPTFETDDGDIVDIDEKPVQKRTGRKKNSVNVDEVQEENAKTLNEIFKNDDNDKFMKVK